jgi:hypothetical protein
MSATASRNHRTTRISRSLAAATALAAAALLAAGGTAQAASYDQPTATIWDGFGLSPNTYIANQGDNGQARLVMQGDGNLVAYYLPGGNPAAEYPTWASGTVGCGVQAVMRADGDLVVLNASGGLCWESGTAGHPEARLTLWRNGDLLISDACNSSILWERLPGTTYVTGQSHGALASPDSTESPYIIRPVPSC